MTSTDRRLFLSYGSRDASAAANQLRQDLTLRGFEVWQDSYSIPAGREWEIAIIDALRQSQAVVSLLSPHAVRRGPSGKKQVDDSPCLDELSAARFDVGIPIVPAMVELCEVPFSLARLQYADLTAWQTPSFYSTAVEQLVQDIEAALAGTPRLRSVLTGLAPRDDMPFLRNKRTDFEGREWLFASIEQWLDVSDVSEERALLITGDPGIGKTSIVAELVHREDPRLIGYYCCRADAPTSLRAFEFVRSLVALLAARIPGYAAILEQPRFAQVLSEPMEEDPVEAFDKAILSALSSARPAMSRTVYVLIDALDEAFSHNLIGPTIIQLLAPRLELLPPWLRVVATSRRDPQILRQLSGLRLRQIDAHGDENVSDLRSYLERRLAEPVYSERLAQVGMSSTDGVSSLLRLADGNFLVAREALRGIQRGLYEFNKLGDLPPGLEGIYTRFFSRVFDDLEEYRQGPRRILETISAAYEPLTRAQIAAVTSMNPERLRRGLLALSPYLREEDEKLSPWHKSLMDWLTTKDSEFGISVLDGHARFADVCVKAWAADASVLSTYALRYVAKHLVSANSRQQLGDLFSDLDYVERRVRAGMTFHLADEYTATRSRVPADHVRLQRISLIAGALSTDALHLSQHPEDLMPILLNAAHWSRGERAKYFDGPSQDVLNDYSVLNELEQLIRKRIGRQNWLRSITPPHNDQRGLHDTFFRIAGMCIQCLTPSPDGRWIATGEGDLNTNQGCHVRILDLYTGREILVLPVHASPVTAVAFDQPGKRLASCSRGYGDVRLNSLRMCFADSGIEQWRIDGLAGPESLTFSPDGQQLACASERSVLIINANDGKVIKTLEGHDLNVNSVVWSNDGHFLVSGSADTTLRIWDPERGTPVQVLRGHEKQVSSVALTPDGKTIVSGAFAFSERPDRTVRIWDAAKGAELAPFEGVNEVVRSVSCSPDGRFACAGFIGEIRIFELVDGREHAQIEIDSDDLTLVTYLPDGRIASCGDGGVTINIWDPLTRHRRRLRGHAVPIEDMAFTPDGAQLLTAAWDGLGFWDSGTGKLLELIPAQEKELPRCVSVLPRGQFVSLGHRCFIWDGYARQRTLELEFNSDPKFSGFFDFAQVSADGMRIWGYAGQDGAYLWDSRSGRQLTRVPAEWISFPASGNIVFVLSNFQVGSKRRPDGAGGSRYGPLLLLILDAESGLEQFKIEVPIRAHAVAPHPHEPLVVLFSDSAMALINWKTRNTIWSVTHPSRPRRGEISNDGKILVTETHVRDHAVYQWELASGKCLNRIVGKGDLHTIVDGARNMDHWLISRASELVAEDARDGSRLAGTPATMQRVLCSPDRRTWATLAGGDRAPNLVVLEGARSDRATEHEIH
jgi:WD40 repeat protein